MARRQSSFFKTILKILILIVTVIYIAASFTPYINPINCFVYTFLALAFPYILLGMLLACVLSFWVFKKRFWLFFLLVLLGYKNILATTGFHFLAKNTLQAKPAETFRLLSWNVNEFQPSDVYKDTIDNPRRKTLAFIKNADADVICLQDFRDYTENAAHYSNKKYLLDTLKYSYHYFAIAQHYPGTPLDDNYGVIFLSKYPIIDSGKVAYDSKDYPEHIAFADILVNGKKIRFYNTHLASMQLTADRKNAGLNYTYVQDDTAILLNTSKLQRIAVFDSFHVKQAQIVKQQLNKSTKPFVFCADLNAVPSSYVYHHISKGLQDAFLQTGLGWGATYDGLSHTLRIDVTLLSPGLKVVQHYSPRLKASDHFPLVTDIALP